MNVKAGETKNIVERELSMKKRYIVAAVLLIAMGGYFYVEQKKTGGDPIYI